MQYRSFQKSFKIPFFIGLKRCERLVLEKILKKNENIEKEIKPKNRSKLPRFQTLANRQDCDVVIGRR